MKYIPYSISSGASNMKIDEDILDNVEEYAMHQYDNIEEGDVEKIATDIYRKFFRDSLGGENG